MTSVMQGDSLDKALSSRLKKLEEQIQTTYRVEVQYGEMKAHEDVLFAELFLKQTDMKQNLDTKKSLVYASKEWRDFAKGLAIQSAELNRAKRLVNLMEKAYDAEHLTFKIEAIAINRQG